MDKIKVYGFMYRGNGYGFWEDKNDALQKASEKARADYSDFALQFGRPEPTIWEFSRGYLEKHKDRFLKIEIAPKK